MEDEFQHYNVVITHSDSKEVSCEFGGVTQTVVCNTVRTSVFITRNYQVLLH